MKTTLACFSIYYFITALWPIIHYSSFEKISGPKKERWLVYTVSLLLLVTASVVLYSTMQPRPIPPETLILALGNSACLIVIDVYFSLRRVIRKTYLIDAFLEASLMFFIILNLI